MKAIQDQGLKTGIREKKREGAKILEPAWVLLRYVSRRLLEMDRQGSVRSRCTLFGYVAATRAWMNPISGRLHCVMPYEMAKRCLGPTIPDYHVQRSHE